jgi:hypothetical protein
MAHTVNHGDNDIDLVLIHRMVVKDLARGKGDVGSFAGHFSGQVWRMKRRADGQEAVFEFVEQCRSLI